MGPPFRLSDSPWSVIKPAPLLGQHNKEVFIHDMGMNNSRFTQLESEGVI